MLFKKIKHAWYIDPIFLPCVFSGESMTRCCSFRCNHVNMIRKSNGNVVISTTIVGKRRKGSCGIMSRRPLTSARPRVDRSTPSTLIAPDSSSTSRNRATANELFPVKPRHHPSVNGSITRSRNVQTFCLPAPVLPAMPIRSPGFATKESPSSARGSPSRYLS